MYTILLYFSSLIHLIVSQSTSSLTCEKYKGAEPCILCENCDEKNDKIHNISCQSMKTYFNESLEINHKNVKTSCYKYGYESELIKHREVDYQQRISVLPPTTGVCYFNISYNHFLNESAHVEDILYIGGKMDNISHWWDTLNTCSQNKNWKVKHSPWDRTKYGDRSWRFRYQISHIKSSGT